MSAGQFISINDILGAPNLCGVIQQTVSGIRDPFPPAFYTVDHVCDGDTGEYKVMYGTRTTSKLSAYGAPSQNRQLRDISAKAVKLMHSVENIVLPIKDYINLLEYNNLQKQKLGIDEVTRQIKSAREQQDNTRIAAMTSMLFLGNIYWDNQGNLLTSSSGATTTVSYGVPSGNTGQLNVLGNGNIINQSWNYTGATIDQQLLALRQAAIELTGYDLKHAFYGKNVVNYLTQNTGLGNYFYRAAYGADAIGPQYAATGDIPNPLLGFTWHRAYETLWYQDRTQDETSTSPQIVVGDDQVVFTPEPSLNWIGMLEGTYPVPDKAGIVTSAEPQMVPQSFSIQQGRFAYGIPSADPPSAKIVYGDTFLPILKVPQAIFVATVRFGS